MRWFVIEYDARYMVMCIHRCQRGYTGLRGGIMPHVYRNITMTAFERLTTLLYACTKKRITLTGRGWVVHSTM